jgi:hypothetical protein
MSSKSRQVAATCGGCGNEFSFKQWVKVSANDDPDLKQKIHDGSLFRTTCPSCGLSMELVQDLRYTDLAGAFYIFLYPSQAGPLPDDISQVLEIMSAAGTDTHIANSPESLSALIKSCEAGAGR